MAVAFPLAIAKRGSSQYWHLCWQAAVGRSFFPNPVLYDWIRLRLIEAHRMEGRTLIDYCLLPTEIHVVSALEQGQTIAGVARSISNVISRWVRLVDGVRSPLYDGPYRAVELRSTEAVLDEVRMLAWRPVHQGYSKRPAGYAHGGYQFAVGKASNVRFDTRPLLSFFEGPVPVARRGLAARVLSRPSDAEWKSWELMHGLALASGTMGKGLPLARELRTDAALLVAASETKDIDGAVRLLESWVRERARLRPVATRRRPISPETRRRALVACLAQDHRLCSAATLARHFGRSKATLSEQMAASRRRVEDKAILSTPVRRILQEVAELLHHPGAVRAGHRRP